MSCSQPLQIISTGDQDEACQFILNEENLNSIIGKIPPDMKVGVIAVVGAFRTGKSFLLNFFLRYLRNSKDDDLTQAWMVSEGDELIEGNLNEGGWSLVESGKEGGEVASTPSLDNKSKSFQWRGGQKRQTTGIWMWSEPFIRSTSATNGEEIAILLMDTQGMFDNETTMTLTAQIFGLSTLVSSFQVYNVCRQIQEDNLQHLALFSEYGRMALMPKTEQDQQKILLEKKNAVAEALEESKAQGEPVAEVAEDKPKQESLEESEKPASETQAEKARKPFQRLQFLIRDWQNFDGDFKEGDSFEDFQRSEMQHYLSEVFRSRKASDLQSTREQILRCFEELDCFMLPYPGSDVTKKTYDGSIKSISADFRALLNEYVRKIFDKELDAKVINNRHITGLELKNFFEVYVKMFQAGEKQFPQAMTMLEATAKANNRNAYDLGLKSYKDSMNALVGNDKPYVKDIQLHQSHEEFHRAALQTFNDIATMGSEVLIDESRQSLLATIETEMKRYFETNALKNPYRDMEYYILPMAVAVASYFLAKFTDKVCSTDFCERVEDTFQNIYLFVFAMMLVLGWRQIRTVYFYLREMIPILAGGGAIDIQSLAAAAKKNN